MRFSIGRPLIDLPLDVLQPILAHLSDRRDWHSCALVNKEFNKAATPLLYRTLDSRIKQTKLYHPSATLINRPELAKYVRKVKESGAHFVHRQLQPNITHDTLKALSLCINLHSLTWTDDSPSTSYVFFPIPFFSNNNSALPSLPPTAPLGSSIRHGTSSERDATFVHPLLCLLGVIREIKAPLRKLTIRSHSDLGSHVWSELSKWTGLCKISIWCMEGPPRVLQGWAGQELGKTLTQLVLGRCAGVPPTILISVISQLPLLQHLHLKGTPPAAVLSIFSLLPSLCTLDTEFLNSGTGNIWPRGWPTQLSNASSTTQNLPALPTLRSLTVRTSSIYTLGPSKLFPWIRALVVNPGLESLRLLAFTTSGYTDIPRSFILDMARLHGDISSSFDPSLPKGTTTKSQGCQLEDQISTSPAHPERGLRKWVVGQAQMTLSDIECVCKTFPELEELACSVAVSTGDVESIVHAILSANNLHTLRLHVQWIPPPYQARTANGSQLQFSSLNEREIDPLRFNQSRSIASSSELPDSELDPESRSDDDDDDDDEGAQARRSALTRRMMNHYRYSGDAGDRDPFGFDAVRLGYAPVRRFMAAYGFYPNLNGNPSFETNGNGSGHVNGTGPGSESGNASGSGRNGSKNGDGVIDSQRPFTLDHARVMMIREGSKLRVIVIGGVVYTGRWMWDAENAQARLEVECAGEEE